jgi:hypothetical protein
MVTPIFRRIKTVLKSMNRIITTFCETGNYHYQTCCLLHQGGRRMEYIAREYILVIGMLSPWRSWVRVGAHARSKAVSRMNHAHWLPQFSRKQSGRNGTGALISTYRRGMNEWIFTSTAFVLFLNFGVLLKLQYCLRCPFLRARCISVELCTILCISVVGERNGLKKWRILSSGV